MFRTVMKCLLFCCCLSLAYLEASGDVKSGCKDDKFKCNTRKIIKNVQFCDGFKDCEDGFDENGRICNSSMEIMLVGGKNHSYGRLKLRHLGSWGNLWAAEFTQRDARVICHMLGYDGPSSVIRGKVFGRKLKRTWFGGLNCVGFESSIHDCDQLIETGVDCDGYESVAVSCSPGPVYCGVGNYRAVGEKYLSISHSYTYTEIDDKFIDYSAIDIRSIRNVSDVPHPRSRRVVDGEMAETLENFPWIAELSLNPEVEWVKRDLTRFILCGAAIISPYFVLTAAHCFDGIRERYQEPEEWKSILRVTVGEYHQFDKEPFEEVFEVDDVIIHGDYYKKSHSHNDIAIIKLKAKDGHGIHFNNHVQPVCLPSESTPLIDLRLAVAGGWGISRTEYQIKDDFTEVLHLGEVPILSRSVCEKYAKGTYKLDDGHLCAGKEKGGTDTCRGDSGGPLVQNINGRFTLLGLTSHGPAFCGKADSPGVYANVKHFLPWIVEKIQEMNAFKKF